VSILLKNNRWSILWGLLILVLTLLPGSSFPKIPSWIDLLHPDKLIHFFTFAVFTFLLADGFRRPGTPVFIVRTAVITSVMISLFFGGLTEVLQGWVIPLRTADWKDFRADAAGTLVVAAGLWAHRFLKDE
jgi:VanZ family protein